MRERVLVGTSGGLHELGAAERRHLAGCEVTALAAEAGRCWAIVDGRTVARRDGEDPWEELAAVPAPPATCLAPTAAGLLVGTAGAHLLRLEGGALTRVESLETVAGRASWYTPWGDPPDTRSIAVDAAGALYVNVHVGGVVRSRDGGRSWSPTVDIETDVHQVVTHPEHGGHVWAASATGLGWSTDGGESWRFLTDGLHADYCRAAVVTDAAVLVAASTGPGGRRSAVYRRPLAEDGPFERCRDGLPGWFGANVDTHCLAARGATVVLGTEDGRVFVSADAGRRFELLAKGLPPILCVAFG